MKFSSDHFIVFFLVVFLLLSLTGCLLAVFRKRKYTPDKPEASVPGKKAKTKPVEKNPYRFSALSRHLLDHAHITG